MAFVGQVWMQEPSPMQRSGLTVTEPSSTHSWMRLQTDWSISTRRRYPSPFLRRSCVSFSMHGCVAMITESSSRASAFFTMAVSSACW